MKSTRRGLFGMIGGAIAATVLPKAPAESAGIELHIGPPWRPGDVVEDAHTRQRFEVQLNFNPIRRPPPFVDLDDTPPRYFLKPKNWRDKILKLYPKEAPLLKMLRERHTFEADFKIFEGVPDPPVASDGSLVLVPPIDVDLKPVMLADYPHPERLTRIGRTHE